MSTSESQKKLKALLKRRHPEYEDKLPHWEFLRSSYEGGREWFTPNIFRYVKEGDKEYKDRVGRAYRFNHTREVVDLVDKYLFKMEIFRKEVDAPESVKSFWRHATLNRLSIDDFMKQVSKMSSIYGRIWIVVDTTKTNDVVTVADEKNAGVRAYAYFITPEHLCDISYDELGEINWALVHEQVRDDENPLDSSGKMIDRYRLWTREDWTLFTVRKNSSSDRRMTAKQLADSVRNGEKGGVIETASPNSSMTIEQEGPFQHQFNCVPIFPADNVISNEPYTSSSLIDDVAYLDRAATNYLSNLDAIIQDQTFSQLVMPAQGLVPGEDGYDKIIEMGTKRIFTFDGEAGSPAYISPDVKQAEIILKVINKIINEIYHTVGLAGERTKEDNAMGIDNSSGVAKAYDFERVNSLLASKADSLEVTENRIAELVAKLSGDELEESLIHYPDNFDVRGLYDEFEIAARLSIIEAPDEMRREQMKGVIDKLFPKLAKDLKEKMVAELKTWPPKLIDPVTGQEVGGDQKSSVREAGKNSLANKLAKE
ncbi:phage portal protein [Methyloversatilis sp.]|uniref:phage portal protein n=1 Tax=Methyloversatilis sp. TaxID=2569862 RepID=UPI0035B136F7